MNELEKLRARLREINGLLKDLAAKTDKTDADYAQITTLCDESEAAIKKADLLERAEKTQAALVAIPAAAPAATPPAVQVLPTDKRLADPLVRAGLLAVAAVHVQQSMRSGYPMSLPDVLRDAGFGVVADEHEAFRSMRRKDVNALNSAVAAKGGITLPDNLSTEILPLLYAQTTFLEGGPRRVPLTGGQYRQLKGESGSVAGYRGELKPFAVTGPKMKDIQMFAKLAGAIVVMSDQIMRWSLIDIGAWVRTDLLKAAAQLTDLNMYFGLGTVYTPLGIFNIPGITKLDASEFSFVDPVAPVVREIDAVGAALELAQSMTNLPAVKPAWRMPIRFKQYLTDLRGTQDNLLYPTVAQGMWRNKPILTSTNFSSSGGVTTDEGDLALIDFDYVMYGETLGVQFATSDQATVTDGSNTIGLWQQGASAIKMEFEHDVDIAYPQAVGVVEGLRWGANLTV